MNETNQVLYAAIYSRCIVISLLLLSFYLANEYDDSTTAVDELVYSKHCSGPLNSHLLKLLRPFVRWDAVHFLDIAEGGYLYEDQFAFFPGVPVLIRWSGDGLHTLLGGFLCQRVLYIMIGVVLSNTSFILAAISLYRLGVITLRDKRISKAAAILFCFSPGGAFMSSVYTESIFALLTFQGMIQFEMGRDVLAALIWMLSSCFRSNGIAYAGFFIWNLITKRMSLSSRLVHLVGAICIFLPFVAFQHYGFVRFCQDPTIPQKEWCQWQVPTIYSYVQSHYWNVGFLRYYNWTQLPSFIIALPLITVSIYAIAEYVQYDILRFLTLGYSGYKAEPLGYHSRRTLPYVYLTSFLFLYCLTVMHVQIINRFFTSVPVLFWYLGHLSTRYPNSLVGRSCVYYFGLYGSIQSVLFAAFLPPA